MSDATMTRFELGVYIAPENAERFQKLLAESGDDCLLLSIEKLIGIHLSCDERGVKSALLSSNSIYALPEYGEGVCEVYAEGDE